MSDAEAEANAEAIRGVELAMTPGRMPNWRHIAGPEARIIGARKRARPINILWLDTPGAELARRHLSLSEAAGTWRLTPISPGPANPPTAIAAPIFEARDLAAVPIGTEVAPVPVASFTGETLDIAIGKGASSVTIRRSAGSVRGVATETELCHLELSGEILPLLHIARGLAAQGAFVPPVSLAAAGALLAHSTLEPPSPALAEDTPLATAFALGMGRELAAVLHAAGLISTAAGSAPVHQMRVAIRRFRSLLGLPRRSSVGPAWLAASSVLGAWAHHLGEAREWDVLLETTLPAILGELPDHRFTRLLARAKKRREASYAALRAWLAGDGFRIEAVEIAILLSLRLFVEESEPELWALSRREFAVQSLDRRLAKLKAAGDNFAELDPIALHELRKHIKRLRYASDFFADLWDNKTTHKYLKRLADVQETLGHSNDAHGLEPLLARLGARGFAAGLAVGMSSKGRGKAVKKAEACYRKLLHAKEFWA